MGMTDRERLWKLLERANFKCHGTACDICDYRDERGCFAHLVLDHLIANGVTVQRWIPVTERFPENEADVLVCYKDGAVATNARLWGHWWFKDDKNPVTHWMPLPEPPKEGE